MNLPVLNNSRAKCYRSCPRKYLYAYEMAQRPVRSSSELHFGTVFHKALEAWLLALKDGNPEQALPLALCAIDESDLDPFTRVKAEVLMAVYHERWIGEPLQVLGVEKRFHAPLVNPATGAPSRTWQLSGTLDALVRRLDTGDVWIVEHKTSGEDLRPESDYWARLRMNSQISTYMVGGRALLYGSEFRDRLAGCLYDVIGKPKLAPLQATPVELRKYTKPTKANPEPRLYKNQREEDETVEEFRARVLAHVLEDPSRYINRAEVVRLEEDEVEAAADMWMQAKAIRESQKQNAWPRNPDACHLYRRQCDYWPVCVGEAEIDDPIRYHRVDVNERTP